MNRLYEGEESAPERSRPGIVDRPDRGRSDGGSAIGQLLPRPQAGKEEAFSLLVVVIFKLA